jgi:dTDP-4-amino-4,6-dideoxygalactose transaminase
MIKSNSVNDAIQEVLDTNTYINGPQVHQFQNARVYKCKTCYPLCKWNWRFANCYDGSGLKPGDEVITDYFAATVEVIALLQLTSIGRCIYMNMNIYRRY